MKNNVNRKYIIGELEHLLGHLYEDDLKEGFNVMINIFEKHKNKKDSGWCVYGWKTKKPYVRPKEAIKFIEKTLNEKDEHWRKNDK